MVSGLIDLASLSDNIHNCTRKSGLTEPQKAQMDLDNSSLVERAGGDQYICRSRPQQTMSEGITDHKIDLMATALQSKRPSGQVVCGRLKPVSPFWPSSSQRLQGGKWEWALH